MLAPACLIVSLLSATGPAIAGYGVQVGAFAQPYNATRLTERISRAGFPTAVLPSARKTGRLKNVVVGPFPDMNTARATSKLLAANGWQGYIRDYPVAPYSRLYSAAHVSDAPARSSSATSFPTKLNGQLLLAEETAADKSTTGDDLLIIEDTPAGSGQDTLIIDGTETETDQVIIDTPDGESLHSETDTVIADTPDWTDRLRYSKEDFTIGLDKAWLEYGNFYSSDSTADHSNYGHAALSAEWNPDSAWEVQLSGRLDWYRQTGDLDHNDVEADYGDSFVRYRGGNYRLTAGFQKVVWGRIDEVPPTDRISRVDLARGILDDLSERRRAMPVVRFETFSDGLKLDAVWMPDFRKANLPDKESVWYPINQENGTILGFDSTPLLRTFVRNGSISQSAPSDHDNFGLRLSNTGKRIDYALTIQHARQSAPYWELNPTVRNTLLSGADPVTAINSSGGSTFRARYPTAWVAGGDFGFEALSATWRFEAAWISDTPVTRSKLRYDEVDSVNWAAGAQFYPGDRDVRVNLQLSGINLIDAPSVQDRKNIYNFNGTVFSEFGNNRWQSNTRFFIGLDEQDFYINPEISFIGWDPHEIYAAWHYFNGDDETVGGYWEDSSLLTLGWRSRF